METAQIIDKALFDYYFEQGRPVPPWRKTEPQWWIDYLIELGYDPRNP